MAARTDSVKGDKQLYISKPSDTYDIEADIADCMPQTFARLWQSEKRCNLFVSCKGAEFKVHSLILYAYSPFFADQMDKSPDSDKVTADCDADLLTFCLEFLYTGRVVVDSYQLGRLTEAADFLGIKHLYEACKKKKLKDITEKNCLEALCFWDSVGEEDMKKTSLQMAAAAFAVISETEGFMNLCSKCVAELVTNENLEVSSPGDRLSAAISWLEHNIMNRAFHVVPFLQQLPLGKMSNAEIRFALRSPVVQKNVHAARIINEALEHSKSRPKASIQSKVVMVPETQPTECLVSLARLDMHRNSVDNEVLVTPVSFDGEWRKLTDLPADPPKYNCSVGCVALDKSLYVTGLGESNKEAWYFTFGNGKWKQLCDLQNSRVSHCMAVYDGGIYAIGGRRPRNDDAAVAVSPVEVLFPGSMSWQYAGDLKGKECCNSCITIIDEGILVYGNFDGHTSKVQLYKPKEKATQVYVTYMFEKYVNIQGIVKTKNHVILCSATHVYAVPLTCDDTARQAVQKHIYHLPRVTPSMHLSRDEQYIYTIGGIDGYDERYTHYIHRAPVKDLINNTGSGWQGVTMNWPTSQQILNPGAHCTAMIKGFKDLELV